MTTWLALKHMRPGQMVETDPPPEKQPLPVPTIAWGVDALATTDGSRVDPTGFSDGVI